LTLANSLSLTLRRIHDSKVAIEVISDHLLVRSEEVKELEDIDAELNAELEAETRKWHSRWPEPEECCMILKMELSRGQAELEANY
jgi:rRNA maturation endonuclease Nob1